jgi:ABC-type multidrug transport system permease subunit
MKKLMFEQYKNFKIMFRNITSLFLLIIGPLFLILLIGFAYSGDGIHDINIGIIAGNYEILEPAFQNFSNFANIKKFDSTKNCLSEITEQNVHICLEFSDDFITANEIPSGSIVFYFDNSQKSLSNSIVTQISNFFGVQAEKISIDSAKTIFANIENMVVYLHDKNQDIFVLVNESKTIKNEILLRRDRIVSIKNQFTPIYDKILNIQNRLNNVSNKINVSYKNYHSTSNELLDELENLKTNLNTIKFIYPIQEIYLFNNSWTKNISQFKSMNYSYINLSNTNYTIVKNKLIVPDLNYTTDISSMQSNLYTSLIIDTTLDSINSVQKSIFSLTNSTTNYYNDINQQKKEFDSAVLLLKNVQLMLETDIQNSEIYANKIDTAVITMIEAQSELNKSLNDLGKLSPEVAEKLVKPILQNYEPLLPGIENIKIAFPVMLTMIIIFISILFSNIITLTEINSKAFRRNLIAPVSKLNYIIGLIITNLIIVSFQVLILLLVAQFSFKINIMDVFGPLFLLIFLMVVLFTCIGMIFALLIRNEQASILTTTFAALSFFLFSNAVTPLETMPKLAAQIASFNPYVIAGTAFRKNLIFNVPLIKDEIMLLFGFVCFALGFVIILTKNKLND